MLVTWSIVAFLISALCWILGDALIVGFRRPDRHEHGEFIDLMGDDAYAFYTRVNARAASSGKEDSEGPDPAALEHARRLYRFLMQAWGPAIGLTALGWLLVCIALGSGATAFPRWSLLLTPPVQSLPWYALTRLPYPGKPLLDGALFNIVNLVWAIAFLVLMSHNPLT